MNSRTASIAASVLACVFCASFSISAQSNDRVGATWSNANSSSIVNVLRARQAGKRAPAKAAATVLKFVPIPDSGVAQALADALGSNPQEIASLKDGFLQIKQVYEAEVAKEGKSNNLAAAFTLFIAANVMAYGQIDEPSDAATEALFGELQGAIADVPEFARLSNLEKQKMHDWLVFMGGFVMAGYTEARTANDKEALQTYRSLADYSLRLVLGVSASELSFAGGNFSIATPASSVGQPASAAANANGPAATAQSVVGTWSKSASSPWGLAPGTVATNAGYYKGQYQFKPDGSYSFKGESWGGYSRSNEFWTIEENGSYTVGGDSLTISPRQSSATQRDRDGAVTASRKNPLEKTTYKFKFHYFEGLNEMNLVLETPRETTRDGGFSGNSLFPSSYLYGKDKLLEWRF